MPCPVGFSTQRPGRVPQCRPPMGLVIRDQGARRKSMPEHRRRRATKRSATTPIGPKGCGGMSPSSSLPLLGDGGTSSSSRRLESGPMALATDDAVGPGRASRGRGARTCGTSSTPRRESTAGCGASAAAAEGWRVMRVRSPGPPDSMAAKNSTVTLLFSNPEARS